MLDEHTFGIQDSAQPRGWRAWYRRDRPAILATAWLWLLFLVLALVSLFTGWASLPLTLFLQLLVSLGAGVLAADLHRREKPENPRYVRMGALAGFYLPLTTTLVILGVALAAGLASFGALLPFMIPYFMFLPVELGACSLLGATGSWLYQFFLRYL